MKHHLRRASAGLVGLALASMLGVLGISPGSARAAPPETFPLSQVKPGQTGYGITTFSGTTPERFTFEVVSVVTNMLPKQDIILVKSDDPKLKVSGFWRGMSGSPLFIDGKLLCAFSYGWSFNKVPLGGCTPIEYMKTEGLGAVRRGGSASGGRGKVAGEAKTTTIARPVATAADWRRFSPSGEVMAGLTAMAPTRSNWILQAPTPARPAAPVSPIVAGMPSGDVLTAAVPLSLAGFSPSGFAQLGQLFAGYGVMPVRASGTGGGSGGPKAFELGGSISVQLIRGDMSAAATGTVSYIDDNRVLAFGHPMFQAGEFYAPVASAEVNTVIASAQSAFVLASPRRELGALVQDRQSTIMADTKLRSPMIPLDIFINASSSAGKQSGEFHVEILDNKFWTAQLAGSAADSAIEYYLPDRDDATVRIESLVRLRGLGDIRFTDYLYAGTGAGSVIGGARGLRVLVPLLMNPFAAVEIERIELRVELRFDANYGNVEQVILPSRELPPGKRSMVKIEMSTYGGKRVTEEVAVDVPASAAGSILQLDFTSGDGARLDTASPFDLAGLLAVLREMRAGNVWVATLYDAAEGVAIDGVKVRDLPPSAADRLHPESRTQRADIYRPLSQTVSPAGRVIVGDASLLVKISDK